MRHKSSRFAGAAFWEKMNTPIAAPLFLRAVSISTRANEGVACVFLRLNDKLFPSSSGVRAELYNYVAFLAVSYFARSVTRVHGNVPSPLCFFLNKL